MDALTLFRLPVSGDRTPVHSTSQISGRKGESISSKFQKSNFIIFCAVLSVSNALPQTAQAFFGVVTQEYTEFNLPADAETCADILSGKVLKTPIPEKAAAVCSMGNADMERLKEALAAPASKNTDLGQYIPALREWSMNGRKRLLQAAERLSGRNSAPGFQDLVSAYIIHNAIAVRGLEASPKASDPALQDVRTSLLENIKTADYEKAFTEISGLITRDRGKNLNDRALLYSDLRWINFATGNYAGASDHALSAFLLWKGDDVFRTSLAHAVIDNLNLSRNNTRYNAENYERQNILLGYLGSEGLALDETVRGDARRSMGLGISKRSAFTRDSDNIYREITAYVEAAEHFKAAGDDAAISIIIKDLSEATERLLASSYGKENEMIELVEGLRQKANSHGVEMPLRIAQAGLMTRESINTDDMKKIRNAYRAWMDLAEEKALIGLSSWHMYYFTSALENVGRIDSDTKNLQMASLSYKRIAKTQSQSKNALLFLSLFGDARSLAAIYRLTGEESYRDAAQAAIDAIIQVFPENEMQETHKATLNQLRAML